MPKADVAPYGMILIPSLMVCPSIEHLWSSLWASRFGPEDMRLRFELGGEEWANATLQVPRFLQAHHRASIIADAFFADSCIAVVGWDGRRPKAVGIPKVKDGFEALQSTGFQAPQISEWRATLYPEPDGAEASAWVVRSYEIGGNKVARDTILWHAVAAEMPIYPRAPVVTFLIDPRSSLMLHVYDDRGMDVIGADPSRLREMHSLFGDWLLDHDRERMRKLL